MNCVVAPMDLYNEKQDGLGSHNSSTYRHKLTNSRYGPYLYSTREQQHNVNQNEYTRKSSYCNNSERDSNSRNCGYALSTRSNTSYEKDQQDNNYGTQTIQGKGNYYNKSKYNCATSSTNRTYHQAALENVDKSTDNVESQNTNYKTLSQWENKEGNCSRNATITSQNYNFATNKPVELSNVQHKNETYSHWENSVNIPNSNISNSNTCTTRSDSGLLQSYPFSFNQKICPSVPNSLDWQSILGINESTSVEMQDNNGNIESVPPCSGTQSNSGLFQSYPFPFNQQVCESVPNLLNWQSIASINKTTNVIMQDSKGNIESVPSYSGSSQLSSCNDDNSAKSSVSDLQSILSSGEDTDEGMKQNEINTSSAQNSADSKPSSKKIIRNNRWEHRKRQMKQERQQARQSLKPSFDLNCIVLGPDEALKLLTPDGTEFLKILGEATNLNIAMNKSFNNSHTCTMEGPEEFTHKAKKAIERFCNPVHLTKPNWIFILSVDFDLTSVRQIFTKLNDDRINWKMSAENLYENLEQNEKQIVIKKALPIQYHTFTASITKLKKSVKFQYRVLNAIILVILQVSYAPVQIQVLKQWIQDGKETKNSSIENAFKYIFKNGNRLDIDYNQVIQMLPQGVNVSLIEKVDHLMTSGVAICEKFQWEDKLKLLKRLYADIIINNYSDESINNLNLNVINLQQWSAVAVLWGGL